MSKIRGRGNKDTELKLASLLRKAGIHGWRRHLALPGRPDFAFQDRMVAIFVDGCFWHGCPNCYTAPRQNASFWKNKIQVNQLRDQRISQELREAGWGVIRVWECHLARNEPQVISQIEAELNETV